MSRKTSATSKTRAKDSNQAKTSTPPTHKKTAKSSASSANKNAVVNGALAIEAVVVGEDGEPLSDVPVALCDKAGRQYRLTTNQSGSERFEGSTAEQVDLALPELDQDTWTLSDNAQLFSATA